MRVGEQFTQLAGRMKRKDRSEHKFEVLGVEDGLDLRVILMALTEDPFIDEVWDDHEALDATDSDIFAAASYHDARLAAQPFTMSDGSAVVDVLKDAQLRSQLIRDMRGGLSPSLLDAYERGFTAGLGP